MDKTVKKETDWEQQDCTDSRMDVAEGITMNRVKTIFTESCVKRFSRRTILNTKDIGIKIKCTIIVTAKTIDR